MQNIVQAYLDMPPVTRAYTTACVLTTLAVQLDFITPFHLYFNWHLIIYEYQFWRLLTSFCYFGSIGFTFFFNIVFTYRHCQMLEEGSFRGRTSDFVLMFVFGAIFMISSACFVHLVFLGHAFTIMIVYVWSRRNPFVMMNFFGLFTFSAPYLPWVLLLFSLLLGNNAIVDIFGIACGHLYYFLEDVFPNQPGGFRIMEAPTFLKWIFDPAPLPHVDVHERPGGFNWGIEDDDRDPDLIMNNNNNATSSSSGGLPGRGNEMNSHQLDNNRSTSADSVARDNNTGGANEQQQQEGGDNVGNQEGGIEGRQQNSFQ